MLKLATIAAAVVLSTGCASVANSISSTQRMPYEDIIRYRIDCQNKEAQIFFLESQLTNANDRIAAAMNQSTVSREQILDRSYNAAVLRLIWEIRTYCPVKDPRSQR